MTLDREISDDDILGELTNEWVWGTAIAERLGIGASYLGRRMRILMEEGKVEKRNPYEVPQYRLKQP